MTITSSDFRNAYTGNGSTTVFAYTFQIADASHLTVTLVSAAGVESVTTAYTVSGVGNAGGGNVTMTTAPASGVGVVITRNQPFQQNTDYVTGEAFSAETHEAALDELTMNDIQQQEVLTRAVKAPVQDGAIGELPNITNRKNKILTFDANGDPETSVLTADLANLFNNFKVGSEISGYSTVVESHQGSEFDGANKITLSQTYTPGNNNLFVFRNGQLLKKGASFDYTETSSTEVTLTYDPNDDDTYLFVVGVLSSAGSIDASNVTYTPAGVGAVSTNVQDYLRSETLESYSGRFIAGTGSAAARPLAGLHINKDATVHANYGVIDETAYNFTSGGVIGSASFNDNTETQGTVNIDHHHSYQSRPKVNTTSGTLSSLTGLNSFFDLQAGAVNVCTGMVYNNPTSTTGTTNYNWGVNIANLTAGVLENIGIFIAGASGGSAKNYSIYCASATAPIHLGGKLDIAFGGTKKADLGWDDTTGSIMLDNISTSAKLNIDTFETRFTHGQAFIGVGTPDATTLDAQLHVKGPNDKVALFLENNHPTDPSEWFISTSEKTVALGGLSFYDNLAAAVRLYITTAGVVRPGGDGTQDLGDATHRWQTVYATTGTINTSDEREKEFLEIEDAEISAAKELKTAIRKYRFKNDDKKRFGIGAQTVEKIMAKHGLNADDYGFFSCVDDRYGINYSELLCFLSLA